MINLSAPTNWDKRLIVIFIEKGIQEIYGKLPADFIGGGRTTFLLPTISKKRCSEYIKELKRNGISFNYLLNATCLSNEEWTRKGQGQIHKLLDWISEIGVTSVTVATPYLLELIRGCYPHLKICVSTMVQVDNIARAKYWEDLGADSITLSESVNRNFKLIELIRKKVSCKLQLVANNACLQYCPFVFYHSVCTSHASQLTNRLGRFLIDYCRFKCRFLYLSNPEYILRSTWIRPEDVNFYYNLGIDSIKLVDRLMTTQELITIITAYTEGSFDGNLFDLLSRFSIHKQPLIFKIKFLLYFLRPFNVNIIALFNALSSLPKCKIHIDNKALQGFIEGMSSINCYDTDCKECNYCKDWSRKVVRYNKEELRKVVAGYKKILNGLVSGDFFSYKIIR